MFDLSELAVTERRRERPVDLITLPYLPCALTLVERIPIQLTGCGRICYLEAISEGEERLTAEKRRGFVLLRNSMSISLATRLRVETNDTSSSFGAH